MATKYTMKDLGYKRTPTDAVYEIQAAHGDWWRVPVQAIVDSRDGHYADEKEDTIGLIRAKRLDASDMEDWAQNNMNWSDVQEYAERVPRDNDQDMQEEWVNGAKEIVGTL